MLNVYDTYLQPVGYLSVDSSDVFHAIIQDRDRVRGLHGILQLLSAFGRATSDCEPYQHSWIFLARRRVIHVCV